MQQWMNKNIKISLLENSHNFVDEALQKAVLAENEPINWKYAIFNLVQSIELLLKERLKREHSILIYQNIIFWHYVGGIFGDKIFYYWFKEDIYSYYKPLLGIDYSVTNDHHSK